MDYNSEILMVGFVTHDVKRFVIKKPRGFSFVPGQATDLSINKGKWKKEKRPFTFTSLNEDKVLEFTIKGYKLHNGVTKVLHESSPGQKVTISKPFGTINYKDKGVFIAGGAGITPFIAILRHLKKTGNVNGNKLIFSNKESKDVILEGELRDIFSENPQDLVLTLTREERRGYENGHVDEEFLKKHVKDLSKNFYVCGPPKFNESVIATLKRLGAKTDSIVFEE